MAFALACIVLDFHVVDGDVCKRGSIVLLTGARQFIEYLRDRNCILLQQIQQLWTDVCMCYNQGVKLNSKLGILVKFLEWGTSWNIWCWVQCRAFRHGQIAAWIPDWVGLDDSGLCFPKKDLKFSNFAGSFYFTGYWY